MALRVTALTIDVGFDQLLQVARGEDREFDLTFTINSAPIDMTGATDVRLNVRKDGLLIFAREYAGFAGAASAGTPRFIITQADTVNLAETAYDCDVTWTDALGYKTQLLVASEFEVLRAFGDPTDPVTSPSPIKVRPGAHATFTGATNVAQIFWPNLGATITVNAYGQVLAGGAVYDVAPAGAVAEGEETVVVWVKRSTITPTGCQVWANFSFTGYARVNLEPT